MEIIIMESSAYKELMEKIDGIHAYVRDNIREKKKADIQEIWLSNKELKSLLGISNRTLQRLRDNKKLDYAIFSGACRYRYTEVERLINDSIIVCNPQQLEDFRKNYRIRTGKVHKKG